MAFETLAVILAAIAIGSWAKGAFGIGLPIIAIPFLSTYLGVEHAIVVMTVPTFASNVWIVWRYRKMITGIPHLVPSLIIAGIGTVAGAWVLSALGDGTLIWLLIVWIAAYLLNLTFNPDFRLEGKAARRAAPVMAAVAGVSQGATGISGPVVATWIHSYRLHGEVYVFGVSIMFLVIAGVHFVAVAGIGLMDQERLLQGALAVIPTLIFVQLGMWTTRFVSRKWFNRIIIAFIVAMEIKMLTMVL